MRTNALICVFALAMACGSNDKKEQSTPSSAPDATIMIVPIDENGKEDISKAEMRSVSATVADKTSEELMGLFESAAPIANVSDDFEESSTQSWFGWRRHRGNQCGQRNFCDYRPQFQSQQGQVVQYSQVTTTTISCTQTTSCCQRSCCGQAASCVPPTSSPTYRIGYQGGPVDQNNYLSPYIGPRGYNIYGWQREVL
jgi:hypothetical protein